MRAGIIGGTGKMGGAIARHLSKEHEVVIGSRRPEKAKAAASSIEGAEGGDYAWASKACDFAVFSLPFSAIAEAGPLSGPLSGKLVMSVVNPIKLKEGVLEYGLESGSAAERLAGMLKKSRVATAFNNVPVAMMRAERVPPMDILVAADSRDTFAEAAGIVRCVPGARPLYAGPLSQAQIVERITPLVLNLAKWNGTGSLAVRFVSAKG